MAKPHGCLDLLCNQRQQQESNLCANDTILHSIEVIAPHRSRVRNEESGTNGAQQSETIGFDTGLLKEPTDRPSELQAFFASNK
ncbi:MAG: hypothetical protein DMG97_10700 [Acidobacteria bacterium]|nr:MAG: hypothetical protein DMG97_10700 [Acidobacteriota bacterium]